MEKEKIAKWESGEVSGCLEALEAMGLQLGGFKIRTDWSWERIVKTENNLGRINLIIRQDFLELPINIQKSWLVYRLCMDGIKREEAQGNLTKQMWKKTRGYIKPEIVIAKTLERYRSYGLTLEDLAMTVSQMETDTINELELLVLDKALYPSRRACGKPLEGILYNRLEAIQIAKAQLCALGIRIPLSLKPGIYKERQGFVYGSYKGKEIVRRILRSLEKIVVIDIVRDKETKRVFDINRKEFIRKNVFELKGKSC